MKNHLLFEAEQKVKIEQKMVLTAGHRALDTLVVTRQSALSRDQLSHHLWKN